MDKRKPFPLLIGAALGVMGALLMAPATRFLVRLQLHIVAPGLGMPPSLAQYGGLARSLDVNRAGADREIERYAGSHPMDYGVQSGAIMMVTTSEGSRFDRLRPVAARFPDSVSACADLLRFSTLGPIQIKRTPGHAVAVSPGAIAEFESTAATGERLEPNNAYFACMRTIGLFAGRQDSEGLAALRRAALEPRWDEHYDEQLAGQWRIEEAALNDPTALSRTAVAAMLLFPHYGQMRKACEVAVDHAIQDELAGRPEEGLEIRRNVASLGRKLRAQGRSLIGTLVGRKLIAVAMSRPGGAPPVIYGPKLTPIEVADRNTAAFAAYVTRVGHPEDAVRAREDTEISNRIMGLWRRGSRIDEWGNLATLERWWMADLAVLSAAFWLCLIGMAARLGMHSRWARAARPLPSVAYVPIFAGAALGLAIGVEAMRHSNGGVALTVAVAALAITGVAASWRARSTDRVVISAAALTALAVVLGGSVMVWHLRSAIGITQVFAVMQGGADQRAPLVTMAYMLSAGTPFLLALGLAFVSRLRREPAAVGMVRGFAGLGVSAACVLIVVYGGLVAGTAREEAGRRSALDQIVQHEGRYIASLVGEQWPG